MAASCAFAADSSVPGWRVGVAKVKITPSEMVWIAGYGARNRTAEGTLQDVWAKALALEARDGRVGVIVTLDVCTVDKEFTDEFLAALSRRYGLKRDQVILNCSHTHSGPAVGKSLQYIHQMDKAEWKKEEAYTAWLQDALADLVGDALRDRRPARVLTGNGLARFGVNRRSNAEARIVGLSELKGPMDFSVPVLKVEDTTGRMTAVLFGYACHPTTTGFYNYNGDYPGFAQEELEKMHPGTTALFFQGAGADINPLPRRKMSLAVKYGKELAAAVEQALIDELTERDATLDLRYREVMLAMEEPFSLEKLDEIGGDQNPDNYFARWARAMAAKVRRGEVLPREWPFPVQYWQIGDQKLFALAGELLVGYTLAIKERFGGDAFVMGYCNDVMSYIPTDEAWEKGGYEVDKVYCESGLPSQWTRDVMTRILNAVWELAE